MKSNLKPRRLTPRGIPKRIQIFAHLKNKKMQSAMIRSNAMLQAKVSSSGRVR
jgi:hypothetical protein